MLVNSFRERFGAVESWDIFMSVYSQIVSVKLDGVKQSIWSQLQIENVESVHLRKIIQQPLHYEKS